MNKNRFAQIESRLSASIPAYQDPIAIMDMRELISLVDSLRDVARAADNAASAWTGSKLRKALDAVPTWVLEEK